MKAADSLCAGLPGLLDAACASLADAHPLGLGLVRSAEAGRALFAYVDAFGSTGYLPRLADLPAAFRPRAAGRIDVTPADLSRNPTGIVESRLLHAGIADEFRDPYRLQQILTLPMPGSPSALLIAGFGAKTRFTDTETARLDDLGPELRRLPARREPSVEELERFRRHDARDALLAALAQV